MAQNSIVGSNAYCALKTLLWLHDHDASAGSGLRSPTTLAAAIVERPLGTNKKVPSAGQSLTGVAVPRSGCRSANLDAYDLADRQRNHMHEVM